MFSEVFADDIQTYTIEYVHSSKDSIWQSINTYDSPVDIYGVIVILKQPKEIGDTLTRQISEYALYSNTNQNSKRGDIIDDGVNRYEVIVMRKLHWFQWEEPCHIHYLKFVE